MSDQPEANRLSDAELEAVFGGATSGAASGTQGTAPINLASMDLESMLLLVQQQRADQLETQLKNQISAVQEKNSRIVELGGSLNALNQLSSQIPEGKSISIEAAKDVLETLGPTFSERSLDGNEDGLITRGELEGLINVVKGQIDGLSNTQQMDMLRLQSLTNKRNEAFEIMTNFVKKMQDSRASIVGNMR